MRRLQEQGWTFGDTLQKEFDFEDFTEAIDFVDNVAHLAEQHNHHPDIHISYDTVRIELITHEEDKITNRDIELAKNIDGLYSR